MSNHYLTTQALLASEEAEEILFALALRSKQKNLGKERQERTTQLGKHLNVQFEKAFGWCQMDRMKHWRKGIKSVNIKLYDTAPPED